MLLAQGPQFENTVLPHPLLPRQAVFSAVPTYMAVPVTLKCHHPGVSYTGQLEQLQQCTWAMWGTEGRCPAPSSAPGGTWGVDSGCPVPQQCT